MWPKSSSISPDDVSMCDSMVPVPNGTSVMTWFIFTEWAMGRTLPRYSSRMAWAASIHSSLRNGYVATSGSYLHGYGEPHAAGQQPGLAHQGARAQPEVEGAAPAHRDVGVHQLRHLHPPLPPAVRRHHQPRDRRHHHPGALLGLREVPRPVPRRLHLPGPRVAAAAGGLVGGAPRRGGPVCLSIP